MPSSPGDAPQTGDASDRSAATAIGRGRSYFTWRLRRDRPDLYARVESGALTVHAAAVEAGMRGRKPSPVEAIQKQVAALDRDDFRAVFAWLLAHAKERR